VTERSETTKKTKKKIPRWVLITVSIVILYFLGGNSIFDLYSLNREVKSLESQIEQTHLKIDSLKLEISRLKTDTLFIQDLARKKLGMAKEHEKVFKFVEE